MGSLKKFNDKCLSLQGLQKIYGFKVLVETGSFKGESIEYALNTLNLNSVYSCDIDKEYSDLCLEKFKGNSKVGIFNQDSKNFLKQILPALNDQDSILFWLDAHFFKSFFPKYNEVDYPLEREIEIIFSLRNNKRDIILVDDYYMYEDGSYEINYRNPLTAFGSQFLKKYSYSKNIFLADKGYLMLTLDKNAN